MQTHQVPPRPDQPVMHEVVNIAPPRRKVWPWIVGTVVVLGIVGALTNQAGTSTTTPDPITSTDSGMTLDEAYAAATPIIGEVTTELEAITSTSAVSSDVTHLNRAADLLDEAAAIFVGISAEQELYLSSAADHLRAAGVAETAGDYPGFQSEITAATDDLDSSVAAVQNTAYGIAS